MDILTPYLPCWTASSSILVAVVIAVPIYCFIFTNRTPRSPAVPAGPADQMCCGLENKEDVFANVVADLEFPEAILISMLGNPLVVLFIALPLRRLPPLLYANRHWSLDSPERIKCWC